MSFYMNHWKSVCKSKESDNSEFSETSRLEVPGGWLYRFQVNTAVSCESRQVSVDMVFVPNPQEPEEAGKRPKKAKRLKKRLSSKGK